MSDPRDPANPWAGAIQRTQAAALYCGDVDEASAIEPKPTVDHSEAMANAIERAKTAAEWGTPKTEWVRPDAPSSEEATALDTDVALSGEEGEQFPPAEEDRGLFANCDAEWSALDIRFRAFDAAVAFATRGGWGADPHGVVNTAKVFENYLNGE